MAKKNNENLSQDMIDNIKSYGDQIKTIEDYTTAIRQTIGYHIGDVGTRGHLALIKEIIQNALDEAVRSYSPCNYIKVSYDERTLMITVEDNGRGIPFESMMRVYTSAYTSANYEKKAGDYTAGTNGSGSKITLALSKMFRAESYILGEARYIESIEGHVTSTDVQKMDNSGKQGTIVSFIPSTEALGEMTTSCDDVYSLFFGLFPLVPIGTTCDFIAIDSKGAIKYNEARTNEDGIVADLIMKTQSPLITPVTFSADNGTCKAEIAFTYDTSNLVAEDVSSFANFCITIGGKHKDGFLDGISNFFRNYMNKIFLGEKSKITVVGNDIRTGLKAVINAAHITPLFNAQAKEILRNEDMYVFTRALTNKALEEWTKNNPSELQKLCKFFKDVAENRMKSDNDKVKLSTKYQASALSGKPKKYLPPSGNTGLELVIVEGDSALGPARNSRCSDRQGLFPIRGKIPNAFNTERSKFLSNSEIAAIITIIGGGYGKNFDIDKVKWDKIITMADADPDGSHINSLLLRFFLLYMPELITAGKLYKAVPPLYGVETRKGKMQYFTDKIEFTRYVQSIFAKNNVLTTLTNQRLTNVEAIELFIRNIDYTYELEIVSNTYAVVPRLLEDILMRYSVENFDFNVFKQSIEKLYRFIAVKVVNGVVVVDGICDNKFHTIFINDKLMASCSKMLKIMKSNSFYTYKVNEDVVSLYQLMKKFENSMPSGVVRYKGLGEQDPEQLGESALHPDYNRTLIRYTIDDIKQEIETIRYLESNKAELFKNVKVTRQDIE